MNHPKTDSIEWHEENFRNFEDLLEEKQEILGAMQIEIFNMFLELPFRKLQISEAKKAGKTSFDADCYQEKYRPNLITSK